jgi:hypothetical protein
VKKIALASSASRRTETNNSPHCPPMKRVLGGLLLLACLIVAYSASTELTAALHALTASADAAARPEITRCQAHWPDIELLIPLDRKHEAEFVSVFYPAYQAFWPSAKVRFVLDAEAPRAAEMSSRLLAMNPNFAVSFNEKPGLDMIGNSRQQLVGFWADTYSRAEFIGFIDSDALLLSKIMPHDVFRGADRPIVRCGVLPLAPLAAALDV